MFFKFPLMYHQDFAILIIGILSFNYFTIKVYCSIADKTNLCVCLRSKEKIAILKNIIRLIFTELLVRKL